MCVYVSECEGQRRFVRKCVDARPHGVRDCFLAVCCKLREEERWNSP